RKVGAPQAEVAATRQGGQGICQEAGARMALSVHEARLPHLVPQLAEPGDQAHLFGDVVADHPDVDDVTAAPKLRRFLNDQHLMTSLPQPVGERRTRDTRPVDDDSHAPLGRPNSVIKLTGAKSVCTGAESVCTATKAVCTGVRSLCTRVKSFCTGAKSVSIHLKSLEHFTFACSG